MCTMKNKVCVDNTVVVLAPDSLMSPIVGFRG